MYGMEQSHFLGTLGALLLSSCLASYLVYARRLEMWGRIQVTGLLVAVGVRLALVPYVQASPNRSSDFLNTTGLNEWFYALGMALLCSGCAVASGELLCRWKPLPQTRLGQLGRASLVAVLSTAFALLIAGIFFVLATYRAG